MKNKIISILCLLVPYVSATMIYSYCMRVKQMDLKFEVKDNRYSNIKDVLRAEFGVSSRLYTKLKNNQKIFLNGKNDFINKCLSIHDFIEVDLSFDEVSPNIIPTKMDLDIIYEDDYFLIVNKSPNMTVHPSINHFEDSLSNAVKYYFDSIRIKKKNKNC